MTTPEKTPPKLLEDNLLEELKETPTEAVGEASRRAHHFTEEDEDHAKRGARNKVRTAFTAIKVAFFWVLFVLLCMILLATAVGFLYLLWQYIGTFLWGNEVHDVKTLEAFILNVVWSILLIFATLFLEGIFRDKID